MTGIEERPSRPNRALSERGGVVREKKNGSWGQERTGSGGWMGMGLWGKGIGGDWRTGIYMYLETLNETLIPSFLRDKE